MSVPTPHPTPERLDAYNRGQLPPDQADAIGAHVGECETCCETLMGLSSDDTFVGQLQQARALPAPHADDVAALPAVLIDHPRYDVIDLIGTGGMGDVYRATHRLMERTVALKVIRRDLMTRQEAVDRFHREVKAAARLTHPNIVTAHDAEQAGSVHFMVMEHVDGIHLADSVVLDGVMPIADVCCCIQQVATGLQHAFEQGMVHRDIKPHNLMRTSDGTIKILDFGLASLSPMSLMDVETPPVRSDLTSVGSVMGTPDFIAPEQARDARAADIRSDIYSLGATAWFLLSGQAPFADRSLQQKLAGHSERPSQPLRQLRGDIPAQLEAVVTKMMAADPADRYQTPADVAAALRPFTTTAPVRKRAGTWLWATAAASALAVLVAGIILFLQTRHGLVRIEVMDDSLQVQIENEIITVSNDGRELQITPGRQSLTIRQPGSDFEFRTDTFELTRGGAAIFQVSLLDGQVVVNKDGESFDEQRLPDRAIAQTPEVRPASRLDRVLSEMSDAEQRDQFRTLYDNSPTRYQQQASAFIARGDLEGARRVLASARADSPEATAILKEADSLRRRGELIAAARSYLNAYRLQPSLLHEQHLRTLRHADHLEQLVDILTEERLRQMGTASRVEEVVLSLLQTTRTRDQAFELLRRLAAAQPDSYRRLLKRIPPQILRTAPDPTAFVRSKLIPADLSQKGDGWAQFRVTGFVSTPAVNDCNVWGPLQALPPVLDGCQRKHEVLNELVAEVQTLRAEHPQWKAGTAVLAFLEALLGNEQRADQLLAEVLQDTSSPIPPDAAWAFALVLEGHGEQLDQRVMELLKRKLAGPLDEGRPQRFSPRRNLAKLYARYGRQQEARRLLLSLAAPESEVVCAPGHLNTDQATCRNCHRTHRSFNNFLVMASDLTDIGCPVDAWLKLDEIDSSYQRLFSSDKSWAKSRVFDSLDLDSSSAQYQHARDKVREQLTPAVILQALQRGRLSDKQGGMNLRPALRGVEDNVTIVSPVLELLNIAAAGTDEKSAVEESASRLEEIDAWLTDAFAENPDDLDAGVAAAWSAWLRRHRREAETRLEQLVVALEDRETQPGDIVLWLAARRALTDHATPPASRQTASYLAVRALEAARLHPDTDLARALRDDYRTMITQWFQPDLPVKPVVVELRWLEDEHIEGITMESTTQWQESGGPGYLHEDAALTLTANHVTNVDVYETILFNPILYSCRLELTAQARRQLQQSAHQHDGVVKGDPHRTRLLAVLIDGDYQGAMRYETDGNKRVADQCKASSFAPHVGNTVDRQQFSALLHTLLTDDAPESAD
ncbi:MAG: serine/threonine protein kinase [Planctomycetaceae bacterium]|nr:serine/threonine protein kinase [Planctomycetaceae bacterium]